MALEFKAGTWVVFTPEMVRGMLLSEPDHQSLCGILLFRFTGLCRARVGMDTLVPYDPEAGDPLVDLMALPRGLQDVSI